MARGFPSMTALLGLLAIAGYQNRDKIAEILNGIGKGSGSQPGKPGAPGQFDGLRDMIGGLSAGKLLNGGLGELLEQFNKSGQKETADSWVANGPNRDVSPTDLRKTLDPDVLQALTRATGLGEDELLSRLSRELPSAVDKYTPDGRIAAA